MERIPYFLNKWLYSAVREDSWIWKNIRVNSPVIWEPEAVFYGDKNGYGKVLSVAFPTWALLIFTGKVFCINGP